MKSEERQQLKTNELGELLGKATEFFDKNGNQILWGFVIVVVVISGFIYYTRNTRAENEAVWGRILSATSAEDFASVADDYEGSTGSAWARLAEADRNLQSGVRLAFTNRPEGIEDLSELKEARKAYQQLINGSPPDTVRERAMLGMARYLETVSDGDLDEAINAYKRFASRFPNSPHREYADRRAKELEADETFYAWFFKQNPKTEDRATPSDGATTDDLTLPEIPDALYPDDWQEPSEETLPGELEGTTPKEEEAPKTPDAPSEPAEEKPEEPTDKKEDEKTE